MEESAQCLDMVFPNNNKQLFILWFAVLTCGAASWTQSALVLIASGFITTRPFLSPCAPEIFLLSEK